MPKFKLTDNATGKSFAVTAPDQASALAAFKKFTMPDAASAVAASGSSVAASNEALRSSLPMPDAPNPQAVANATKPNTSFGLSSSDTLNPLPAMDAFGSEALRNIPVAGPHLTQAAGGNDPQVASETAQNVAGNPQAAAAGKFMGSAVPYAIAAELPVINQVMGFAGPWLQKAIMTGISQYALNTGDNLARGQSLAEANKNAILPSAMAVPLSLLGPGGKTASARDDAVNALKQEGIDLTAGQSRGSHGMMMAESQLGGAASTGFRDKQLGQLTSVALKSAGVDAKAATPNVMDKAYNDAGQQFGGLASLTTIKSDPTLQNGVLKAATGYTDLTGKSNPLLERLVNQIGDLTKTHGGVIPGASYKAINTEIIDAIKNASEPELKGALSNFKEALDDGVARSMGGKTLAAWQKTRQQYANLMRVTDAVTGAGALAAQGLITPEALSMAVRNATSKRQYARGVGDLNELSRNAVIAMPRLPDSGTASRVGAIAGVTSGMAGVGNFAFNHNLPASLAIAGAPLVPMAAGRAMLSAPGRAVLSKGSTIPSAVGRSILPQLIPSLAAPLGAGVPFASKLLGG